MGFVADVDTIQSQLAKPAPNRRILKAAWEGIKSASALEGCATLVQRVSGLIVGLL
jgi:hypothetical protein